MPPPCPSSCSPLASCATPTAWAPAQVDRMRRAAPGGRGRGVPTEGCAAHCRGLCSLLRLLGCPKDTDSWSGMMDGAAALAGKATSACSPPTLPPSARPWPRTAGMFVPSLAVGAAGGRLAGRCVAWLVLQAGSKLPVSLTAYSVIGQKVRALGRALRRGARAAGRVWDESGRRMSICLAPAAAAAHARAARAPRPSAARPNPTPPAGAAAFLGGSTRMTMTTTVMVRRRAGGGMGSWDEESAGQQGGSRRPPSTIHAGASPASAS